MAKLLVDRRSAPWWLDPAGLPGPVLRACLAAAMTAPSVLNTQPWLFEPRQGGVDIYIDRRRRLPVLDPTGREATLSVGAAVFNLRATMRAHGRTPLQVVLPSPHDPDLLVRVSPGVPSAVPYTARALVRSIPRRRSNRWPYARMAVPKAILADLASAAVAEGAEFQVLRRDARDHALGLVRAAEQQRREDPAYRAELAAWTGDSPDRRDGVQPSAYGPLSVADYLPLRDFGVNEPGLDRVVARFEPSPTIAVLYADDGVPQWLRAGQALQRVLLTAAVHGLSASLLTQPLELPRLRELLRHPTSGLPPQAIIRLGYSRRPGSPSRRRPLREVYLPGFGQ